VRASAPRSRRTNKDTRTIPAQSQRLPSRLVTVAECFLSVVPDDCQHISGLSHLYDNRFLQTPLQHLIVVVLITREHRRIHTPHPSHCESCQKTAKFKRALFAEITRINSPDPGRRLHSTSDFFKQYHDSRCWDAYVKIEDRFVNKHSWVGS
jgi:hypothetical protein